MPRSLKYTSNLAPSLKIAFCNQDVFMDPLSIFLFTFQLLLKTFNVLQVIILFVNLWVPKSFPCLVFHTFLSLHLNFFQDWNSCFVGLLLDPFAFINFKLPSNSYCFTNLKFPLFLGILSNLSPYNLYCLNLHLLFPKKLEFKIYNKIVYPFLNFKIYRK